MSIMTDFCSFITQDWINFECVNCGIKIRATEVQDSMPFFPCKGIYLKNNQPTNDYIDKMLDHFSSASDLAEKTTIQKRLAICNDCEFFKEDTCTKCGCSMIRNKNFVGKILKKDSSCPENRW
jgi:hypothetical protein